MDYLLHIGTIFLIFAIMGLSLNLVVGYTGLPSIAHAAFAGIGAYTSAVLLRNTDVNFFLILLVSIAVTMVAAFLIGLVLSKFNDDYYVLASVGFSYIIYNVLLNWQEVTRGPLGIPGISKPEIFGFTFKSGEPFFFLALLSVVVIYFLCRFIVNSSFGRVLKTIREDEKAIQVFGYRVVLYKLAVFVIAAGMAAVAGALDGSYISFIDPSIFNTMQSVDMLVIVIIGGLASLRGSLLGTLIFVLLPELLRFVGLPDGIAGQMRQVLYGLALMLLMLYRPQGILGKFRL